MTEDAQHAPQEPNAAPDDPEVIPADENAAEGRDERPDEAGEDVGKAARLRKRAQEAEEARDKLTTDLEDARGQIDALRRSVIEDIAQRAGIKNPAALWSLGFDPAELVTAAGGIDHGAARPALVAFAQAHGLNVRTGPDPVPKSGTGTGGESPGRAAWTDAFKR